MNDNRIRTMEEAFYLQTKAFLEKNSEHIAEIARLKAEVERLTKAGDLLAVHYTALSKCVTPNNAKSGSINDWTSVIDWNAAKEGKPGA